MKRTIYLFALCALLTATVAFAQQSSLQYFRPYDRTGINLFETTKNDSTPFGGLLVKVGGGFTQDYQSLADQNNAIAVIVNGVNTNKLMPLTSGVNLAMANMNIDVQLADGIRTNLITYLSTRHHNDAWVKAGYIQFDKLPFFNSDMVNNLMKNVTVKIGDLEVDYGDQHFRRTDGGSTMYNPFVENYIMDEFATEVGAEFYYHCPSGFFGMVGITDGELDPTVVAATKIDSATEQINAYDPAFHAKAGYDSQINSDLRVRLTGSVYTDKSGPSNTLFGGDRAGSHYFFVMENTLAASDAQGFSGRFNPSFSEAVTTFMINPFVKYNGLELFGTYEAANGRTIVEKDTRAATQYAVDVLYRFPAGGEDFWVGARYNSVKAALRNDPTDVTINRAVGSIGWILTKNMMLKGEWMSQVYKDFPATDIRSGGMFNGWMMEASVGF
ncbi:MAG TPA: hypothetical protein VKS81_08295 [Bacteroidota bacterium]|nr:hypothetical protein [Bacteroidota bacterium]